MNLAPPAYQFLSTATGAAKDRQLDIHAEPGTFGSAAGFPDHFTAGRQKCQEDIIIPVIRHKIHIVV